MLKQLHTKLDLKKVTEDGEFEGYGAVFNNVDVANDIILPGAFTGSIRDKGVNSIKMLFQHDPAMPIGKWIEIKEDTHGLFVKGKILQSISRGAETLAMLKEGIVDGLSIGFRTIKSVWEEGSDFRQLLEVDLWEVSVVTFPANPKARVDTVKTIRDAERILRDGGVPASFAKLVAMHGFKKAEEIVALDRREGGRVAEEAGNILAGFNFN